MFPKVMEQFIRTFSRLPGIGTKTSERLAFHLVAQNDGYLKQLIRSLEDLKREIRICSRCGNISETEPCPICQNDRRNQKLLCVVEEAADLYAVEQTKSYEGVYLVLGGLIDPLNGISPEELRIEDLVRRVREDSIEEVIFATSATPEGDTTVLYIKELLKGFPVKLTHLARGIPVGTGLQYAGQRSLTEAFRNRESLG